MQVGRRSNRIVRVWESSAVFEAEFHTAAQQWAKRKAQEVAAELAQEAAFRLCYGAAVR